MRQKQTIHLQNYTTRRVPQAFDGMTLSLLSIVMILSFPMAVIPSSPLIASSFPAYMDNPQYHYDPSAFNICSQRSMRHRRTSASSRARSVRSSAANLRRQRRQSSRRTNATAFSMVPAEGGGDPGSNKSGAEEARNRRNQLVPGTRKSLVHLAEAVNKAVLEMCVQNQGRPLAAAMTDLVERGVEAFASGYSIEAVLLELQMLDDMDPEPGKTLTAVEKRYRTQWLGALHFVLQNLGFVEQREPKTPEEFHLKSQVDVVLNGRLTGDEQTFVKFDKALATGGVSGGTATEPISISPQLVPISQLILLGIRALQKLEDRQGL